MFLNVKNKLYYLKSFIIRYIFSSFNKRKVEKHGDKKIIAAKEEKLRTKEPATLNILHKLLHPFLKKNFYSAFFYPLNAIKFFDYALNHRLFFRHLILNF